jgi:lysophospholipase L1-like esterase
MGMSPILTILFTISAILFGHLAVAAEVTQSGTATSQLRHPQLACGPFAVAKDLPPPAPQPDPHALERFHLINEEVQQYTYSTIFFGDSITEDWDPAIWQQYFSPYGMLNAGIRGDRTEHLLWRLQNGNLNGRSPNAIVVLIGTNDVGRNRPAEVIAEGIRATLDALRSQFPTARILLIGLLPRSQSPASSRRQQIQQVNRRIQKCQDGKYVFYSNRGSALLDRGDRLLPEISPDGVHLSQRGYAVLTPLLRIELDRVLTGKATSVSGKSR